MILRTTLVCLLLCATACSEDTAVAPIDAAETPDIAEGSDIAADATPDAAPDVTLDTGIDAGSDAVSDISPATICTPGNDQTCNWLPAGIGLAGHCEADGTCTCKEGIGKESISGKCYDLTWCDPKFVDSCHGNDSTTAITGVCQANGTCVCNPGFKLDANGRCESMVCHGGCPTEGATRCAGGFLQTCDGPANGCAHHWFTTDNCHLQTCNATATQCVSKNTMTCAIDSDCPCGCGCSMGGKCLCTGLVPPTCSKDADCGPECGGLICTDGKCVVAGSHP
jgi:hypothetical protein